MSKDIFWYLIIKALVNPEIVYKEFRATRRLKRGEITNTEAYEIIYGGQQ